MADIRRMDGSKVAVDQLGRNELVAQVLARLAEKNEEGRILGVAVLTLSPEGWYDTTWQWPADRADGFPWGLALEGAVARLLHEMRGGSKDMSGVVPEPDAPA